MHGIPILRLTYVYSDLAGMLEQSLHRTWTVAVISLVWILSSAMDHVDIALELIRFLDRRCLERVRSNIPMPLGMWDFEHCDPKRCSGKKLVRMGMVETLKINQRFRGVCMT